jgi:uncharacterized protein (DUF2225 family)
MSASIFDKLEEIYPNIIAMMPDEQFNTHEFMLKLVQEYQELYVQALIEYSQNDQPSLMVIGQIAKRLKKRDDLVTYIRSDIIENVFEHNHDFEVWQKAQKQP